MPLRPGRPADFPALEDHRQPDDRSGAQSLPQPESFPQPERLPQPESFPQPERLPQPESLPGPELLRGPEDSTQPADVRQPKAQPGRRPCADTGHPIVVGFDGSPASRNALAYATGMARRLAEPLLIVHVAPPGIFCEPLTGMVVGSVTDREHMNRWLRAELLAACDIDGLDVRMVTRSGTPARELAAAAVEYSADALIIGASGRPWRHLAGSVSAWLARHAQCPVIVVP